MQSHMAIYIASPGFLIHTQTHTETHRHTPTQAKTHTQTQMQTDTNPRADFEKEKDKDIHIVTARARRTGRRRIPQRSQSVIRGLVFLREDDSPSTCTTPTPKREG